MQILSRRFGPVEVAPEETLRFPGGLVPFVQERYALLTRPGEEPFAWLQCLDLPELAFLVIPAEALVPASAPCLSPAARREVDLVGGAPALVLCLVAWADPPQGCTVNLLAPLLVNPASGLGRQVLLPGDLDLLRAPLELAAPD